MRAVEMSREEFGKMSVANVKDALILLAQQQLEQEVKIAALWRRTSDSGLWGEIGMKRGREMGRGRRRGAQSRGTNVKDATNSLTRDVLRVYLGSSPIFVHS